jgi:hypothetical protein
MIKRDRMVRLIRAYVFLGSTISGQRISIRGRYDLEGTTPLFLRGEPYTQYYD